MPLAVAWKQEFQLECFSCHGATIVEKAESIDTPLQLIENIHSFQSERNFFDIFLGSHLTTYAAEGSMINRLAFEITGSVCERKRGPGGP